MNKPARLLLLMGSALGVACATYLQIAQVHEQASQLGDHTVIVHGRVVETLSIPLAGKGVYRLEDRTGGIWVMSSKRVPFRGDKVTVKGKLKTGVEIGGRTLGVVLVEQGGS